MGKQEEENIALIKTALSLVEKGEWDNFYALLSDECELIEPPSLACGGTYSGKQAIRIGIARVLGCWDKLEIHALNFLAGGDEVVVHNASGGSGRHTGKSFWMENMELWRIKNGKIVQIRAFFFDTARIAEVY